MRTQFVLLCITLACLTASLAEAKTVFRRTDKISENFKQLDLPDNEIDPNVAPPEPQKIDTIDPEDVSVSTSGTLAPAVDEVIDEAEEAVDSGASTGNEIIDEATNEVESVVVPVAVVAPAASSVAASSAATPATVAVPVTTPVKNEDDQSAISKYCKCTDSHCDCCRNFSLPLIPVRGPGCAKITYLGNEKMSVSIKYGDITLATRTISGKNAKPICVGLPGGYSKFCGRVYGLSKAKENFKACLGFELRAEDEVEAALRVSCFKFGPDGLKVADPEPLPSPPKDEDDDDDIFGFAAGGDDEDEDDYDGDEEDDEEEEEADEPDDDEDDYADDEAEAEAPEDADYGGFSLGGLLDELDDDEDDTKPSVTPAATSAVAAIDETRTVEQKVSAQSKDDKGTAAAAAVAIAEENSAAEEAVAVTPAPVDSATTVKPKKTKKSKKNKKKKTAAADGESDFAFQFLNGLLDFFN